MIRLIFGSCPVILNSDGVLLHSFREDDSLFTITKWLYRNGISSSDIEIPDIKYHELFLILNNLHFYKPKRF